MRSDVYGRSRRHLAARALELDISQSQKFMPSFKISQIALNIVTLGKKQLVWGRLYNLDVELA